MSTGRNDEAPTQCWGAAASSCRGSLSGEHYITRGLWQTQNVVVDGLKGGPRTLSIDNLITYSLCEGHNNALSDVDQCAIDLVNALRRLEELRHIRKALPCARTVTGCNSVTLRVDMLGVERWALKTMLNCTRVFRTALGDWRPPDMVSRFVFGQGSLPIGAGLGLLAKVGDNIDQADRIRFQFGRSPQDEVPSAFTITLRGGYQFVVSWDKPLKDFSAFNVGDDIYTGAGETIWHPTRFNLEERGKRINLHLDFNWTGKAACAEVIKLRGRFRAPPR